MGIRSVEIDVQNGVEVDGRLIPSVRHASWGATTLRLDEVLETIQQHAFAASDYPLILSLDIRCNEENQRALAGLLQGILGESLLTARIPSKQLLLPSPEALKRKIVLNAPVEGDPKEEAGREDPDQFFIEKVWYRPQNVHGGESKQWLQKEMIWRENALVFGTPRSAGVAEVFAKPYFVGFIEREAIEEFIKVFNNN
jgi:hypothetical protein